MAIEIKLLPEYRLWEAKDTDFPGIAGYGKNEDAALKDLNFHMSCIDCDQIDTCIYQDEESLEYLNRFIVGDKQ